MRKRCDPLTEEARERCEIAAQAEQIERELSRIRRALRKPLEAEVSKGELTVPQKLVMQVVVHNDGINLKDLSREVNLAHSTVSGIVDRLVKRGMVERRSDPADGRVARIYPTTVVVQFIRDRIPALTLGPLERALKRATREERAAIDNALRWLRELLENE
jgi:MarR family transcriptional regulator, organic hydroperoxide resistance regulator